MTLEEKIDALTERVFQIIINNVPETGWFSPATEWIENTDAALFPIEYFGMKYHIFDVDVRHCPANRYLDLCVLLPGHHIIELECVHGTNNDVLEALMSADFKQEATRVFSILINHARQELLEE